LPEQTDQDYDHDATHTQRHLNRGTTMLANLKIARKLSLLLILPMAAYLFIVTTESYQRWENIQDLNIV